MSDIRRCPQCRSPIPSGAPSGLCPRCLLAAGLESRPASDPGATAASPAAGFVPPSVAELAAQLPQLEVLELLGKGGMGAVYKARQRELDRFVAVKVLPPEIGGDPAFAQRFTREARALAKLSHPNIVAVYDFGQTKGEESKTPVANAPGSPQKLFYIVMEFVDGINLRQALQAGSISPKEALAVVPQICAALQFAHDEGVVHRDIKPENILVDKRGRVKIADFGLAKLISVAEPEPLAAAASESQAAVAAASHLTGAHQVMGTLRYMAPEQMEATHEVDHRADIYSLGVVFYELLTGELPQGCFAPPSQKVQIDVRLDEVVLRALEKVPELRWQQASQVRSQVEAIVGVGEMAPLGAIASSAFGREYRSPRTVFGMPLVHVAFGIDPRTGKRRVAKGIVAVGDVAYGVLACGGVAVGGICFGGLAIGLFSFAGVALGLFSALGGIAIGGLAWGGIAVGVVALGGVAAGYFAYGGQGFGIAVLSGGNANEAGRRFFEPWAHGWMSWMVWLSIAFPIAYAVTFAWVYWLLGKGNVPGAAPVRRPPRTSAGEQPRFSRRAILGAALAPLALGFPAAGVMVSYVSTGAEFVEGVSQPYPESPSLPQMIAAAIVSLLSVFAPLAVTLLGATAIGQIRRSRGRLYGLPLAVADALLVPLLLLDAIILWIVSRAVSDIVRAFAPDRGSDLGQSLGVLASLVVIGLIDYAIVRKTWRAVSQPIPPSPVARG